MNGPRFPAVSRERKRELERTNARLPENLVLVPRVQWAGHAPESLREVWRSSGFLVQVFEEAGGIFRLSVCRSSLNGAGRWNDAITWDDLQRLKRETGRGDSWAVEIYPEDLEVVDVANMRHLWIMPAPPPFAWRRRRETQP